VKLVNLTLTVAFVSAVYLAWLYVPLWFDDLDVSEALAAGGNQLSMASGTLNAAAVQRSVADKLAKVGYHWEEQDGQQVERRGLGLDPEDVKVEGGPDQKLGRITVDYARTVKLKPLERYWTVRFHNSHEANINP